MIIINQGCRNLRSEYIEYINLISCYSCSYDLATQKNNADEQQFHNVITGCVRFPLESRGTIYCLGKYKTLQEARRKFDLFIKLNQLTNSDIEFYM